jgi:hypothetical protein
MRCATSVSVTCVRYVCFGRGRSERCAAHAIEECRDLSDGYPDFTRTGEFPSARWTVALTAGAEFVVERRGGVDRRTGEVDIPMEEYT